MPVVSVSCNHCGAPLEVAESTRFVTCRHCGSRLKIEHGQGAAYTEVLEELQATQREMADDIETLRLQNELERVDREWSDEQRSFETTDKHGRRSLPTEGNTALAVIAALFGIGFVIFWISVASSMDAPGIFPVFGLVMLGALVFGVVRSFQQADRYKAAEKRYRARRRKVLGALRERGALHYES